ncbi:MAG: urate oxidase [Ktedonobacteraceae bacterium]|nr:urate oxidase [Ktedonobacteraceae bacterium]
MRTLRQLNALDQRSFTEALSSLFEGPPWIVAQAWQARPFSSLEHLHRVLCEVMYNAPREQQIALLNAHPDLVGRAALAGTLSPQSTGEQAAAGLNRLSQEEIATFQRLNRAYREKFGFPFVICARENKKASILAGFSTRLNHTCEQEISIALAEVAKICALRLHDIVTEEENLSTDYSYTISYGKLHVPLYRVYARPLTGITPISESSFTGRDNTLLALEVDMEVLGSNFLPAYTQGDNSPVIATDSMKNFILRHALAFDGSTLESFLDSLGRSFMSTYPIVEGLILTARELPFEAVQVPANGAFGASNVLFKRSNNDFAVAELRFERAGDDIRLTTHCSGRVGLQLLKVTGSAFTQFVRDAYTTLPERRDRPLYIYLDLHWKYLNDADMLDHSLSRYVPSEQVRDLVQATFHEFVSESIQQLVHEMGTRLLARFPQLAEVSFAAQNRTRDPVAESATDEKIKVYSDPFPAYGQIKLTIGRRTEE